MKYFRLFIALCALSFLLNSACSSLNKKTNDLRNPSSSSIGHAENGTITFDSPRMPHDDSYADAPAFGKVPPHAKLTEPQPFAEHLEDINQMQEIGQPSSGLVPGGLSVKYIIDLRNGTPKLYFINSNFKINGAVQDSSKYHYYFARKYLNLTESSDEFNNRNYFEPDFKKHTFIQGTLQTYEFDNKALYGAQLYPQDVLHEEGILLMMKTLKAALSTQLQPLGFVQQNEQQTVMTVMKGMEALQTPVFTLDMLIRNLTYIPMNQGTAMGFLRVFPKDVNALAPTDIAFFDKIPLDLSVVSGVITTQVQDPGSHINLKSKERKTPNMVLRKVELIEQLKAMDGQSIQLIVTQSEFKINKVTAKDVQDFYLRRFNSQVPLKLAVDSKAKILKYDLMCPNNPANCIASLKKFGGKAAKLGFLAHRNVLGIGSDEQKNLGYRLTPYGFGIPLQNYVNFVNDPKNILLKKQLNDFIAKDSGSKPFSGTERAAAIKSLQDMFYKAHLPDQNLAEVKQAMADLSAEVEKAYPGLGLKKVKIRSSANAEDIPEFDGAGLHSSFGARLDKPSTADDLCTVESDSDSGETSDVETKMKMQPENLTCAIKGVYASLWNQRAVEERGFRRIDHTTVAMGLAVVPSYSFLKKQGLDETANSVVVTRVVNSPGTYGYMVSTQEGDNLATNPTPGTQAELCVATFISADEPMGLSFLRFSRPKADVEVRTSPILQVSEMKKVINLSQKVEKQYCLAKKDYYNGGDCNYVTSDIEKPTSLDLEFKFLGTQHQILCKQVREFSGK
ncbi:MAG: PEP/pyruvate-binding domain-containing protein [Pseudobdellovibrio sp.]